ncbi:uncharacterized protein N7469_007031 [Penicillium citrinum]|uniref:EH domain-containing protein n=1 Tax=Penicillium citrinum TaxID=5077 RepID=A0A9W9NVL2_PENCI|nr:uncharacterized protein N7469_007031 [Penicillium citrinum]KAJ5227025.1 hypothetical protein N7469_007031 [Penicillium citrinum]KAK5791296.1 hypothetical protein VI817_006605 [Penicillium citrinum]
MNGEIAANPRLTSPASRNASALQGASVAFQQSRSSPNANKPPSAAAAAAVASTWNRQGHAESHRTDMDSDSAPEVGSVRDKIGRLTTNTLAAPTNEPRIRGRAPSSSLSPPPEQIAARLAASRSPDRRQEATSAAAAARLGAMRSASRAPPPSQPVQERRELRSPTPIRPTPPLKSPVDSMLQDDPPEVDSESTIQRPPSVQSKASSMVTSAVDLASSPKASTTSRTPATPLEESKPALPPRSSTTLSSSSSIKSSAGSVPALPPRSSTALSHTSSIQSTTGSIKKKPVGSGSLVRGNTPSMGSMSVPSNNSSSSLLLDSNGMSEEALSNAIVASSLASARASPVSKLAPTPPPRRRARSRSLLQQLTSHSPKSDMSRTPSPPKGMPQTLRGVPKHDEVEERHRHRKHLLHKHPHKHHEGDRKRWRREVTEKERKRYEGVWASNKGLLIPPGRGSGGERRPPPSDMVLNLVVREIWSRSRLPTPILEQVWDLVDTQGIGMLTKEEFVVGMWLIDQQLKGHKLPTNVPDSVWDSVRYVTGIRLTTAGGKTHV